MRRKLFALVGIHLVACLSLAVIATRNRPLYPPIVAFMATAFSESALLAFWAVLGRGLWRKRAFAALLGAMYLWWTTLIAFRPQGNWEPIVILPALVFGCTASLAGVLSLASRWRPGFRLVHKESLGVRTNALQFSLGHLMLVIAVVSVVFAGAELMKPFARAGIITRVLVCIVLVVCFVEAVLAAFWASLSPGRIAGRAVAALVLAMLTGFIPPFYFRLEPFVYLITAETAVLAQAITIGSLLIVRSCGFRLVRHEVREPESEAPGALAAHPLD